MINMQYVIEQFVSSRRLHRTGNLALFTNLLKKRIRCYRLLAIQDYKLKVTKLKSLTVFYNTLLKQIDPL